MAPLTSIVDQWSQVLIALWLHPWLLEALGAIMQSDIKRMMAYSSITHMGYARLQVCLLERLKALSVS